MPWEILALPLRGAGRLDMLLATRTDRSRAPRRRCRTVVVSAAMEEEQAVSTRPRGASDDQELVAELKSGDRARIDAAFARLVATYSPLVTGIAASVTRDSSGALDVRQNVFLKVLVGIDALEDPDRLKSWIGHIARTTSIDWMRRRKHLKVSLDDLEEKGGVSVRASSSSDDEPSRIAAREETRHLILAAISELPEKYREVIMLKHIADHSYQEIADTLGITVSAVESRLYRARTMLRSKIEKLGGIDESGAPEDPGAGS